MTVSGWAPSCRLRDAMLGFGNLGQYALGEGPVPVAPDHSAILDATEQYDIFLGILRQWNIAVAAYVDVIENDPNRLAHWSIIESDDITARVTILVAETTPSTGSPVSQPRARVGIIVR